MSAGVSRPQIIAELRDILNRVTNGRIQAEQVREDARIFDHLGLTSLELLELRFDVESTWNIMLDDRDTADLQVVSDVIKLIESRAAAQPGQ